MKGAVPFWDCAATDAVQNRAKNTGTSWNCILLLSVAIFCPVGTQAESVINNRYIRVGMVAVALLLAASANLLYLSCDPDHDETTPPVVVEFSFVMRAYNSAQTQQIVLVAPVQAIVPGLVDPAWVISRTLPQASAQRELRPSQIALPLLC